MTGQPARGYKWRDAWPGNDLALKHGAWSDRRVGPLAAELTAELAETAPWTSRPAFRATVAAWARVEARVRLVSDWLDTVGDLDEQGRPRPATVLLDRLEARAGKLRAALGLDPGSLARLMATVSAVRRSEAAALGGDPLDGVLAELMAESRAALTPAERPLGPGVMDRRAPALGTAEAAAGGAVVEGEGAS
ncbi:MAG: hypothetical protein M0Z30_14905 [Actinomycetota bacterium]|nr:hypothetical protein [Actinomycetota bacterium]